MRVIIICTRVFWSPVGRIEFLQLLQAELSLSLSLSLCLQASGLEFSVHGTYLDVRAEMIVPTLAALLTYATCQVSGNQ